MTDARSSKRAAIDAAAAGTAAGRIPVYSVWQPEIGPILSLGMLLAYARSVDGGVLNASFDFRPMETAESALAHLRSRSGPAVWLSSDYVWSIDHNLRIATEASSIETQLLHVHGGPSVPSDEVEAEAFLGQLTESGVIPR